MRLEVVTAVSSFAGIGTTTGFPPQRVVFRWSVTETLHGGTRCAPGVARAFAAPVIAAFARVDAVAAVQNRPLIPTVSVVPG